MVTRLLRPEEAQLLLLLGVQVVTDPNIPAVCCAMVFQGSCNVSCGSLLTNTPHSFLDALHM